MREIRNCVTAVSFALMCASPVLAQGLNTGSSTADATRQTPDSFSALAKRLMPSVVNISTSQRVIEAGLPDFPQGSPMERFNDLFGRDDDGFRRT